MCKLRKWLIRKLGGYTEGATISVTKEGIFINNNDGLSSGIIINEETWKSGLKR